MKYFTVKNVQVEDQAQAQAESHSITFEVTSAEKKILEFIKNKLPKDVADAYLSTNGFTYNEMTTKTTFDEDKFSDQRKNTLAVLEKIQTIWGRGNILHWMNTEMTNKYKWLIWHHSKDAEKFKKLWNDLAKEREVIAYKYDRYKRATETYKLDLIKKLTSNEFLNKELSDNLINTAFGSTISLTDKTDEEKLQYLWSKLENDSDYRNKVHNELKKQNKEELILDLEKLQIIPAAADCLKLPENNFSKLESISHDKHKIRRTEINNFSQYLKDNKDTLLKNPDSAFMKFAKGLGVAAASIFGLGIGGYFAYQRLFHSKREKEFLQEVSDIKKSHIPKSNQRQG